MQPVSRNGPSLLHSKGNGSRQRAKIAIPSAIQSMGSAAAKPNSSSPKKKVTFHLNDPEDGSEKDTRSKVSLLPQLEIVLADLFDQETGVDYVQLRTALIKKLKTALNSEFTKEQDICLDELISLLNEFHSEPIQNYSCLQQSFYRRINSIKEDGKALNSSDTTTLCFNILFEDREFKKFILNTYIIFSGKILPHQDHNLEYSIIENTLKELSPLSLSSVVNELFTQIRGFFS